MDAEKSRQLREPFPPSAIGKKPQPYVRDSPKGNCRECGGYHGLPAMHLDFVGHAVTTGRLLDVDPEWTWEPMATDAAGLPARDHAGNLWIRLTVCGVTRPGVGDGVSAKEAIGDAIRNAAMRFGVALDLWSRQELERDQEERPAVASGPSLRDLIITEAKRIDPGLDDEQRRAWINGELTALGGNTPENQRKLLDIWKAK